MTADQASHATVTRAVIRVLDRDGALAGAVLRRSIRTDQREHLNHVLAGLVASGRVKVTKTAKGQRYALSSPNPARTPNAMLWCTRCNMRRRRPTGQLCSRCITLKYQARQGS